MIGRERLVSSATSGHQARCEIDLVRRDFEHIDCGWLGGGRSSAARPIFPPACASKPQAFSTCAINAVVVDFPLVPVMATMGAAFFAPALATNRAREQLQVADHFGAGFARAARPDAAPDESAEHPGLKPAQKSRSRATTSSSGSGRVCRPQPSAPLRDRPRRILLAPPALSDSIAEIPDRANPNTPTDLSAERCHFDHWRVNAVSTWTVRPAPERPRQSKSGSRWSARASRAARNGDG